MPILTIGGQLVQMPGGGGAAAVYMPEPPVSFEIPSAPPVTYTGSTVTPTWQNYDSTKMTISGQTSGVDVGSYVATFTLKDTVKYRWSDGTSSPQNVTWTIDEPAAYYFGIKLKNAGTVSVQKTGTATWTAPLLYWSKDKENWTDYYTGTEISANAGEVIYWYSNDGIALAYSYNAHLKFVVSTQYSIQGYLTSLLKKDESACPSQIPASAFESLFRDDENLIDASQLGIAPISVSVLSFAFRGIFENCTNLVYSPATFPSVAQMNKWAFTSAFEGCTSLKTAPVIPATPMEEDCYAKLFKNCSSLTTPPALPATSLWYHCYESMFEGCTSLTSVPALPARTLTDYYYKSCYCYSKMFDGCSSLIVSDTKTDDAPYAWRIPKALQVNDADSTHYNMFRGCAGTRASDDLSLTQGSWKVYYTQKLPVS